MLKMHVESADDTKLFGTERVKHVDESRVLDIKRVSPTLIRNYMYLYVPFSILL